MNNTLELSDTIKGNIIVLAATQINKYADKYNIDKDSDFFKFKKLEILTTIQQSIDNIIFNLDDIFCYKNDILFRLKQMIIKKQNYEIDFTVANNDYVWDKNNGKI